MAFTETVVTGQKSYLKTEKDKKKLEELIRLGQTEENLGKGVTEVKKHVSPEIGKILDQNKGDIIKNKWSEQLRRHCGNFSLCTNKPPKAVDKKPGVGISSLDKFIEAMKNIGWDIFTLVMGLLGLTGIGLSKDTFMRVLRGEKLKDLLGMKTLLGRLKSLLKRVSHVCYRSEGIRRCLFCDYFDATTSSWWETLKARPDCGMDLHRWCCTGGRNRPQVGHTS